MKKKNIFFKSKTFALRPVGNQDLYPFIQIDIRCVHSNFPINVADEIVSDGMVVGEVKQEQFFNIDGFLSQAFTAALKYLGLKIYFPKKEVAALSSPFTENCPGIRNSM